MFVTREEYEALKALETKVKAVVRYCRNADDPDVNDVLIILGAPQRVEPEEQIRELGKKTEGTLAFKAIG